MTDDRNVIIVEKMPGICLTTGPGNPEKKYKT